MSSTLDVLLGESEARTALDFRHNTRPWCKPVPEDESDEEVLGGQEAPPS